MKTVKSILLLILLLSLLATTLISCNNNENEGKKDYAIFSGFAPLESPEITVCCILEEGEYGYKAAYTVGKIMEKYYELKSESAQTT